ncbi:MAG: hypothetical protein Q9195_001163 [Heterodermia aff. obscurata]
MAQPPTATEALEGFASLIASYEHRVGHACRAVASQLPALLKDLPLSATVLDNACGTGAATEELVKILPSARIYAVDVVPAMVESMKAVVAGKRALQESVMKVELMNGQALSFDKDFFDISIANFGIFFFPEPSLGAKEIYRTLKPGGYAILTVWKEFGFKPVLWEVQDRVKPVNPLAELPLMEPWCDGTLLHKTLQEGGFSAIEMKQVTVGMWGSSRNDFVTVLLENFGAMVARNWTNKEKAKLPAVTATVLEEHEDRFCIKSGDRIGVPMTAWVAVCRK